MLFLLASLPSGELCTAFWSNTLPFSLSQRSQNNSTRISFFCQSGQGWECLNHQCFDPSNRICFNNLFTGMSFDCPASSLLRDLPSKNGKRKEIFLGRSKETLLAGYLSEAWLKIKFCSNGALNCCFNKIKLKSNLSPINAKAWI